MRWIEDRGGRFRWRPWYGVDEIEVLCEERVRRFLRERHGVVVYPLSTDDLTVLIEQEADDLDLYADLSGCGGEGVVVEGLTLFARGRRPRVRIARALYEEGRRAARLRTTLAHELGHVLLHSCLADRTDDGHRCSLWEETGCSTLSLEASHQADWLEWQAGYASGALLMPRTAVQGLVQTLHDEVTDDTPRVMLGTMIDRVQAEFLVSAAAGYIRLRQLGYLSHGLCT